MPIAQTWDESVDWELPTISFHSHVKFNAQQACHVQFASSQFFLRFRIHLLVASSVRGCVNVNCEIQVLFPVWRVCESAFPELLRFERH
jgi:hypothetical protein